MADKVETMTWLELVDKYKLKDGGLKSALRDYSEARIKDECDEALKALATIAKVGADLKNSKEAKAAGPDVIKRIGKLLDGVATSKKDWEKKKVEQAKTGTQQDVQIILERWDGKPMYGCLVKAELSSMGGNTVKKEMSVPGTVLKINDVFLNPKGTLALNVYQGSDLFCSGTAKFEFALGKDKGMQFRFTQASKIVKKKAKSIEEASEKLGLKGEAGLELKVLKVGGEVTKETEYKKGYENDVEWEVEMGEDRFKEQKQV